MNDSQIVGFWILLLKSQTATKKNPLPRLLIQLLWESTTGESTTEEICMYTSG